MNREKIIAEFDEKFCLPSRFGKHILATDEIFGINVLEFILSKIAEAEQHMAEIAIEQINAIECDLMEEEHECLSDLCKYAREEINDELKGERE